MLRLKVACSFLLAMCLFAQGEPCSNEDGEKCARDDGTASHATQMLQVRNAKKTFQNSTASQEEKEGDEEAVEDGGPVHCGVKCRKCALTGKIGWCKWRSFCGCPARAPRPVWTSAPTPLPNAEAPAPSPPTSFRFKNVGQTDKKEEMCLDWRNSDNSAVVWKCHDRLNQRWYWSGSQLKSVNDSSQCLDWDYGGGGRNAVLHPCHDGSNQKWTMDASQRVHSQMDSNKCLDWAFGDGKNVIVYKCHGWYNQQWEEIGPRVKVG